MKIFILLLSLFISAPAFAATQTGNTLPADSGNAAKQKVLYSANVKTKKYHKPECEYYYCRDCTARFPSRQAA